MKNFTKTIFRSSSNAFNKFFAICSLLLVCNFSFGQTTIASEGFNNTSTLFTVSGGAYYTGNSGTGDRPASSPFAMEGSHSYGVVNNTATLTSSAINTSAFAGISMTFRLAGFSVASATNGLDNNDFVTVEVSPDGGTTYYSTVRTAGNSNAYWAYSTGTGNASTAYDGNTTPVDFIPTTAGGNLTTDGYSTVTITGLPAVTALRFRITLLNNATAEQWNIDDFKLTGTAAIISAQTGNWSETTTWVGGVVPTSASNVIIASGHVVTLDTTTGGINTRNSGTATTVAAGGTLATSVQYINNGTTTINGTFQLNAGGFTNSGNNFVYGSVGTLNFNNTSSYGVNNSDQYWPTTSGPFNVNVLQGGMTLNTGANRTVGGTFQTSAGITLTSATLTLNGAVTINAGGFFNNSPVYGSASSLIYSTGATFGRGAEWNFQSVGTIGTSPGYPNNVTVTNNTTLNFPNGTNATFFNNGTVTINSGSSLFQNFSGGSAGLSAGSTVTINGSMTLGTSSGDLTLRSGNLVIGSATTLVTNGRAVIFAAPTGNHVITKTGGGTINFDYFVITKTNGAVVLDNAPNATSMAVNATAGDVMQITGGALSLNNQTLTFNNTNGNILTTGTNQLITSGTVIFNGNKSISGTGNFIFQAVTLRLFAGLNFGPSYTSLNSSTTLQINPGGFVNTNAPIYQNTATLEYNGVSGYGVNNEWNGNLTVAGLGTPQNVTLTNSSINMPAGARSLGGNLIVGTGSILNMNGTIGADLTVRGNFTNSGTFNSNSRLVTFNGTAAQTITGATTFDFLTLNNATGLTLANPVTVNQTLALTSGRITLGANNLTVGGLLTGASATNYIVAASTGQLRRTVGGTSVDFPVGNTAYNPITFTNSGTSDVYGVRVVNTAPTGANPTKTVTRQWITTEAVAGGSNLAVVAQYNTGETGAGFATSTDNFIGFYNGSSYIQAAATHAGANPFTVTSNTNLSPTDMTTGTQYFAIGRDNAFLSLPNRYVVNAIFPTSPTAGIGFSATVSAQDAYGASTMLPSNSSFVLTSNGNAGTISGSTTGTIFAGPTPVVNLSGIILPNAGTGVTLTATNTSGLVLNAGTSSSFNVLAPASQLAFVGVPATGNVTVNLTSFTVEARRPDNTVDNTYTGTITISKATGTGNLTGTLTATAVAGVATFNSAQFDSASTYTLNANSGSLTQATSGNIVVTLSPLALGTYTFTGTASASGPAARLLASGVLPNVSFSSFGRNTLTINAASGADDFVFSVQPSTGNFGTVINTAIYQEFTVTPSLGYYLNLGSITFSIGRTGAGATNYSVRSSIDNYTTDISTGTVPTTAALRTATLSGTSTTAVTYRIYLYGGGSTGFVRTDDVTFNGNAVCVQPVAYTVTGGGTGCANPGVAVGLSNSQIGVSYQLKNGAANVGSPVAGTGAAISFGNQTTAATYTVVGSNTNGTCSFTLNMTGSATVTLNPIPTLGTISATPVCAGSASTVTLTGLLPNTNGSFTYTNSYTGTFVYTVSGVSDASGNFTFSTPALPLVANGAVITITSGTVTATGCTTTFTGKTVTVVVNPILTASVSIAASATTICAGTSVTFTATPINGGASPSYQWYVGATPVGTNSATYTTTTLANADSVSVVLTSNATPCLTGSPTTSNSISITVNPIVTASVSIAASATTICSGTSVTFTATPTNGGSTPSYQWYVGATPVGTDSATYTTTSLANADSVSVVLTSNATPCLAGSPTTSNSISITVNPILTASVSIAASATTICAGTSVTFTATPTNGGSTPSYQWYVGATPVGSNSATFTSSTLTNGNSVSVVLTSNATPCLVGSPATSNSVSITVNPILTASVSIAASATTICAGTSVTFIATPTNGGATPSYQWYIGVTPVGTNNATFTSSTLTNGSSVSVVLTSNATPCLVGSPATSNSISITVNPILTASVSITASATTICSGTSVTFTATPTNGGSTPNYQWYVGATPVGTNNATFTATTLANTNLVTVVMTSNLPCVINSPATSNGITMSVNPNTTYYQDLDGDGFGNPLVTQTACFGIPVGYVSNNLDCNDNQLQYLDADGDGFGVPTLVACGVANNTDCNDANPAMNTTFTFYTDADGDGFGSALALPQLYCAVNATTPPTIGLSPNNTDCDDTKSNVKPGAVDVCYDGIDNDCNGNIDNVGLPGGCIPKVGNLQSPSCGATVPLLTTNVSAINIPGAQAFRFKITNMATNVVQIYDSPSIAFQFISIAGVTFATQYKVEVAVKFGGVWQGFYGTPCFVYTPSPTSEISTQCGTTVTSFSQIVNVNFVANISMYRFEITNQSNGQTQYVFSNQNKFTLSQLAASNQTFATNYFVRVALRNTDGTYLPEGAGCIIRSQAYPTTQVRTIQCSNYNVINNTESIFADANASATSYRFRLFNGSYDAFYDSTTNKFSLSNFSGLSSSTTYSVQVAITLPNNPIGPYGKICSIKTPAIAKAASNFAAFDSNNSFEVVAYPNPFAANFKLDVSTNDVQNLTIRVYDMLGKLVEVREVSATDVETLEVGANYPSGVYNVIVIQGENSKTQRIIKR